MTMQTRRSGLALFACAALFVPSSARSAETFGSLIKSGDICDLKFQSAEALQFYLPAEKLDPHNTALLIHIARQYRHLMSDATTQSEKLRLGGIALSYAQRAVQLAPDNAEAQLAVAISYGKMLPFQGKKEQVEESPLIRDAAQKAVKLDPRNDLAWHILGRWHKVMADVSTTRRALATLFYGGLPTSTNEEAVKCFQKAIDLNPKRMMHYVELGRTFAQMGRSDEAKRYIAVGLAMPNTEKDDPETKRLGRETLAALR